MRIEMRCRRALVAVLLAAVVFAPAPRGWNESSSTRSIKAESLAQILSPTFDQGVIREGIRASFSAVAKRREAPTNWAVLLVPAWSVLFSAALLVPINWISKLFLTGSALLGSRAPPQTSV